MFHVHARAREERGFGLMELLMAMTVLNIGILALVAAFNSGILTIRRATMTGTATVLADQQMELYRALTWDQIRLAASTIPSGAPYTTDPAYSASQVTGTCSGSPVPNECSASRTVAGSQSPDHHPYRVDTFIVNENPTASARTVKRVTVVVRDGVNVSKVWVRQASTFDCSTGQPYGSCPTT
jgi:Tfp pilus assembly protein PilV